MSYSRRELYAFGEAFGDSATRKVAGRTIYGGGGMTDVPLVDQAMLDAINKSMEPTPAAPVAQPATVSATATKTKSPFQDLTAGSETAQSVSAYRAGNPPLWGNMYAAIQTGQMKIGPSSVAYDSDGNPEGTYALILDAQGEPTGWKAEQVGPNAYDLQSTHGDYLQHMVFRSDPASGYIEPIQNTSQQVNFGRWNYGSSGLAAMLQNPVVPIMANALLPGAGSAVGSALGLGEGALASAVGSGVVGGGVSALTGGDIGQGALSGALGSLVSGALQTPTADLPPVFEIAELPTDQLLSDYANAAASAITPTIPSEVQVNPVNMGNVTEAPIPDLPSVPEASAIATPETVMPESVPTPKTPSVFSEVMEIPTEDLTKAYSDAALPPVQDLSSSSGTPFSNPTISDIAGGAALGGAAGAVAGTALESLIPEVPAMPTYTAPKNNPDYSKKFDAPVQWGEVPNWDFTIDTQASPYLSQSQAGQFNGQMLFDPSQVYASGLLQGLRSSSNAPGAKNAGFTLFNTTK